MYKSPQNQIKQKIWGATTYLLVGIMLLIMWSMIATDINYILNSHWVDKEPNDVFSILFFKYLILAGIWGCLTIGILGLVISIIKYFTS